MPSDLPDLPSPHLRGLQPRPAHVHLVHAPKLKSRRSLLWPEHDLHCSEISRVHSVCALLSLRFALHMPLSFLIQCLQQCSVDSNTSSLLQAKR